MDWFYIMIIAVAIALALWGIIHLLQHRLSHVSVSRFGVELRMNDWAMWSEIRDKVERIDTATKKSIRKATVGMMILDPSRYEMSAEVMLVIDRANQPLIYASYENHHSRELDYDGADIYTLEKAADIHQFTQIFRAQFPELTNELIESYVHHWIKTALIPAQLRACREKVKYYAMMNERCEVCKTIKKENERCIAKNERYIENFNELSKFSDIQSGIRS